MITGPRQDGVNANALVASSHGGARLSPRLLQDGRYALPEASRTDPECSAASSIVAGWTTESPTNFAVNTHLPYSPLYIQVDGKSVYQVGRRAALTMPHPDVFRCEVQANDFSFAGDSTNINRRCEFVAREEDGAGAETAWTSFCFILGDHAGLTLTSHGIVHQWHSKDYAVARAPVVNVNCSNAGLQIRTASSASVDANGSGYFVNRYTTTLPNKGVKTYVVLQITFGEVGHLNAWVNGSQVVNTDCPIGYYSDLVANPGAKLAYPHFGLYTRNQPPTDVVYIANPEWGLTDLSSRIGSPLPVPDLTW